MTAVTLRGTFKKDSRPNNGLESIAGQLQASKLKQHFVVGVIKYAGASVSEDGVITPAAKFLAIEPLEGDDARQVEEILDRARKVRGLGIVGDIPAGGQLAGQTEFDFDGPDDEDEREVPEPTAEEIMAERAEAKAAAEVPAAAFSGSAK
jgi:hypothetical protein